MSKILLISLMVLGLFGCHTSQQFSLQKLERYPMKSTLFAEVKLEKKDLISLLHEKVDEALLTPFSKGSIQLTAKRNGEMVISLKEGMILISLPIDIEANLSSFAKANGTLQIRFKTTYDISSDWQITTYTESNDFQWITEPKAKFLGINFPIEKLSNVAINQVAPKLAQTIDEQMAEFSNLRPMVEKLLEKSTKPVLLDSSRNLWLTSRPSRIGIAPFFDSGSTIFSGIFSEVVLQVYHEEPKEVIIPLPKLEVRPFKDKATHIVVNGIFSANSLSDILKEDMIGLEIPFRKKKIVIDDIDLDFAGRLLLAKIKVSGAINGYIDAVGAPHMNDEHTQLEIDDFDIKLTGSNLFMRKGIKLLKKRIEKTLKNTANRKLDELSMDILKKIKTDYKKHSLSPNLVANMLPDNEILFNFELKESGSLYLQISLSGHVQLQVSANGKP